MTRKRDEHDLTRLEADAGERTRLRESLARDHPALLRETEPIDEARFAPGTVLGRRFRIVGLLGSGGMGEVYRADDLKLKQPVALKFLPDRLVGDGAALARFHREVRLARQVSHPNVCRVFDIGEVDGLQFLSMEYIDGEDLASLLRRIGRLPADKAIEIARQLCAGLAAAHDAGVLHRDLKPANVMIDGRGRARITDFGIAIVSEDPRAHEAVAGTPGYMSPEQSSGQPATAKSDLYSLGLVLYELFTGQRAFKALTLAEYRVEQQQRTLATPSSFVKEIDPAVERVILRCLERDPAQRPASAIHVAAALPGGDPLQAALAAGETPSPEMVAAAGERAGLRPAIAIAWLAAAVVPLIAMALLGASVDPLANLPTDMPPEVLVRRARDITAQLGYPERPVDTAHGFREDDRWLRLVDGKKIPVHFWYRESPSFMRAVRMDGFGTVTYEDPPHSPGMTGLELDAAGRLRSFYAVPPAKDEVTGDTPPTDWSRAFSAAGLEISQFTPTDPVWIPRYAYDARAAWTGRYPDQPTPAIRVEIGTRRGKTVFFSIVEPWLEPVERPAASAVAAAVFQGVVYSAILIGAAVMARRNIRLGRGDRRGANRLAAFAGTFDLLAGLVRADHIPTAQEDSVVAQAIRSALLVAGVTWVAYLAFEPVVRRRWPTTLVTWSRLLEGKFRDPVVGRDVLLGLASGMSLIFLDTLVRFMTGTTDAADTLFLDHGPVASLLWRVGGTVLISLVFFFVICCVRIVIRRDWIAVTLIVLLFTIPVIGYGIPLLTVMSGTLATLLLYFLATRIGLLALVSGLLSFIAPSAVNLSAWYGRSSLISLAVVLTLAVYAFRTSLAGQPLLRDRADA